MSEKDQSASGQSGSGNGADDRSEGAVLAGEMTRLAQVVGQLVQNQQALANNTAQEMQNLSDALMPLFASLHLMKHVQRRILVLLRRADPDAYDALFEGIEADVRGALESSATLENIEGSETASSFNKAVDQVLATDWPDVCREVRERSQKR